MAQRISTGSVINNILMKEVVDDPAVPAANFWQLYTKANGLYIKNDAGNITGPIKQAGSGGWEFITETILGAPGTFTFNAITNAYNKLRLELTVRGAVAAGTEQVAVRMGNGGVDAGANYAYYIRRWGSAVANINSVVGTELLGTIIPGNTAAANYFGQVLFEIYNYKSVALWKDVLYQGGHTAAAGERVCVASGLWRSLAVVDTLYIFGIAAANMQTGSVARLYGSY